MSYLQLLSLPRDILSIRQIDITLYIEDNCNSHIFLNFTPYSCGCTGFYDDLMYLSLIMIDRSNDYLEFRRPDCSRYIISNLIVVVLKTNFAILYSRGWIHCLPTHDMYRALSDSVLLFLEGNVATLMHIVSRLADDEFYQYILTESWPDSHQQRVSIWD